MNITDIQVGGIYNLQDPGAARVINPVPPHQILITITGKRENAVTFKALPNQYNPIGYSCDFNSVLSPLGCQKLSAVSIQ